MAVIQSPPHESFRMDMLWNDSRYRSAFIQVIALMLVMLAVGYLLSNLFANLQTLGKDISFRFLWEPASYDINQVLFFDYTSRSPHWVAALVGIMNTLLVAFLGCVTATLLGVTAGVLRLSNNWIVRQIMTVYVETVRNIPLLIQILIFAAAFDGILPPPSAFRGDDPVAEMMFFGTTAATNRGFYFPAPIWHPGSLAVIVTLVVTIFGALAFGWWARRRQEATGKILPTFWIKTAIILVPTLLVFLVMGAPLTWVYQMQRCLNFSGGIYARNSFMALYLALSIYTAAFIAEITRAGILSVSRGQTEAAYALGLQPRRTMNLIVLPQALRVIVPPLISQYLNLTKNSSLALAVGYMDVTGTLGGITLNQTGRELECILLLMLFYVTVSLLISAVMNAYNARVKLKER